MVKGVNGRLTFALCVVDDVKVAVREWEVEGGAESGEREAVAGEALPHHAGRDRDDAVHLATLEGLLARGVEQPHAVRLHHGTPPRL